MTKGRTYIWLSLALLVPASWAAAKTAPNINFVFPQSPAETFDFPIKCDRPRNKDEAAICQQLAANWIAGLSATLTLFGAAATIWTVILSQAGIRLSHKAIKLSQISLADTQKSLELSVAEHERARAVFELEMRPWLSVKVQPIDIPDGMCGPGNTALTKCTCEITNHGKMPAVGVKVAVVANTTTPLEDRRPMLSVVQLIQREGYEGEGDLIFPESTINIEAGLLFNDPYYYCGEASNGIRDGTFIISIIYKTISDQGPYQTGLLHNCRPDPQKTSIFADDTVAGKTWRILQAWYCSTK